MPRLPIILALLACSSAGLSQTEFVRASRGAATIEINAAERAHFKIPRTIYGTFLEPIGRAIYGGLWAQLLENPSFEGGLWSADYVRRELQREPALERASRMGLPLPWEPLDYGQGMRYEPRWGDAANSSRSLLVMALPAEQTGIRQQIYPPVHRTLDYSGSFYARRLSGPPEVELSIRRRNHPEATLAKTAVTVSDSDWNRYQFALRIPAGQLASLEPADFVVALRNESRLLFDQVLLFPSDHVDGMDPEMIALARALKTPLVRFGGNFTSGYHWRDGVGPMDKRVSMLNQAWGIPEYNHFGTDEFLRFCELIGADPQIALNLGSGTPEEAAGWVRYVNERWRDGGGLLWELGNELWGTFQIGYPTLERVAERTRVFSDAVRRADPRARIIATGADPDRFREWNGAQLKLAPGAFQFLSTHFVVGAANVKRNDPSPEFIAESAFALPVGLEKLLREMNAQIDAGPGARADVKIAFTEWLFHGPNDRVPRFTNLGGAIITAGFLNTLMRVCDFTPISDMTGLIEFGGIHKRRGRVFGVPPYWAFRMYSNADATTPVETRVTAEGYDVEEGNRRIPEIRNVPYLDVVSALNDAGDKLTLFCVNRHLYRDIPAQVRMSAFLPASLARIETLSGTSIYQPNDERRPEAIRPIESTLDAGDGQFEYVFPRSSVTVMEISRR